MRRDGDLNMGNNNQTRSNNLRRNRALNISQEGSAQIGNAYSDRLSLSQEEMDQINQNYGDNLRLTQQQMDQINENYGDNLRLTSEQMEEITNSYDSNNQTSIQSMDDMSMSMSNNLSGVQPSPDLVYQYLERAIGRFMFVDFLIGTQCMIRKQGYLFNVGSNWILLYDDILGDFIMCDLYSIKFITFPARKPVTSVNDNSMYQIKPNNTMVHQTSATSRRRR